MSCHLVAFNFFLGVATAKGRKRGIRMEHKRKKKRSEIEKDMNLFFLSFALFFFFCFWLGASSAFQRYAYDASCKWPGKNEKMNFVLRDLLTCGSVGIIVTQLELAPKKVHQYNLLIFA